MHIFVPSGVGKKVSVKRNGDKRNSPGCRSIRIRAQWFSIYAVQDFHTQQEFADRIGMKRNSIAQVELGRNTSDQTIVSICREFNVNETWLRTGEGEMFVELPRNEALTAQIQPLLQGGPDKFRERLVSLLLRLPPEHWEVLERYALELVSGSSVPAPVVKSPKEMSDAELHAELDRQLATEREKAEGMSASGRGGPDTVAG